MRASTWTALASGAALLAAAALVGASTRSAPRFLALEGFAEADADLKKATCGFYRGYTMGMLGFFQAFSNALVAEHLNDPAKRDGAAQLMDAVGAASSQRETTELIAAYLLAHKSNPKAARALAASGFVQTAMTGAASAGCEGLPA